MSGDEACMCGVPESEHHRADPPHGFTPQDYNPCGHDWLLRPESDTYFCEICGDER